MDRGSPGTGLSGCKLGPARALPGVPGRSACGYSAGTGPFGQKKRRRLFRRRHLIRCTRIVLLTVLNIEQYTILNQFLVKMNSIEQLNNCPIRGNLSGRVGLSKERLLASNLGRPAILI